MNDAALSKYYYGSTYQQAELSTPIHSWEHDTTNMGGSYVNSNCVGGSFLEDEQTFFHNNLIQAQPLQNEDLGQDQLLAPEIFKETTTCSEILTLSSNTLSDIPFVQIHTTNLEPPDKSYHNVFRRKEEPIKAEPIKSETTESAKERVNSTPTPPTRNSSYASLEGKANIEVGNSSHAATPQSVQPNVHKCSTCPFISLSQDYLATHVATVHAAGAVENFRPRILCPGCENIFFSLNSFDLHLREDHLMVPDEASSILYNMQNKQNLAEVLVESNAPAPAEPSADVKTKSRIFIKNVNCLRAPQGGVEGASGDGGTTEQQSQIEDLQEFVEKSNNINSAFNINDSLELCDSPSLHLKQTIYIKSVDVLREPGLDQMATYANYTQTDSANINGSNNNNDNHNNICDESNINKNYNDQPSNETLGLENSERPRRPKIYIKNVDILKEPMLFPRNLNVVNIQNLNFNFGSQNIVSSPFQNNPCVDMVTPTTTTGFEDNLPTLGDMRSEPYLYDNTMGVTSRSGGNTNMNSGDFIDTYVNTSPNAIITNHNFTLDNTRFVDDLDIGFNYTNTSTDITELNPSPLPLPPLPMALPTVTATVSLSSTPDVEQTQMPPDQSLAPELTIPKQKIFIKNVDILKAPQVHLGQQHQKGTLHLRTVDELNLMNRNEVENLMAPNHQFNEEQINGDAVSDLHNTSDDLSVSQISDFVPDWPNEDYDLGDDLDCIITDTIEPLMDITKSFVTTLDSHQSQNFDTDPTCPQQGCNNSLTSVSELDSITKIAEDLLNEDFVTMYNQPAEQMAQNSTKQEIIFSIATPTTIPITNGAVTTDVLTIPEIPTLAPVIATTSSNRTDTPTFSKSENLANIVVLPLVPLNNKKDEIANVNYQSPIIEGSFVVEEKIKSEINLHQDSGAPPSFTQDAGATLASQDAGATLSSQDAGATLSTQDSGATLSSQDAGATLSSQDAGATLSSQDAGATLSSQEAGATLSSQDAGATSSPQDAGASSSSQDAGATSSSQDLASGTSVRGRPYGAKRTGITKLRKQKGTAVAESLVGIKCSINGCAFRFKEPETLEYHKRCHNIESDPTHSMICPECKSTNFIYWNSLHTHLWRSHQIDMELYRCPQCAFRTPIYSRLLNTHSKIHSEERNYKCEHCGKGFKNTKQLKNHRRWHRNQGTQKAEADFAKGIPPKLFPCEDCGAAFTYLQSLREHLCKNRDEQIECEVCQRSMSSKSSLKLHMLTHKSEKRFKCDECDYEASDHNAFRRHRMGHLDQSKYSCPHCDAKFIQSCSFQRHMSQKHPEQAADIVLNCTLCSYTTIKRALLIIHQAKHECTSVASNMQQPQKQPRKKRAQKYSRKSVKNEQQQVIPTSSQSSASESNDIKSQPMTTYTNLEAVSVFPLQQQQQVLVPESAQNPYNQNECSGYSIKTKKQSQKQFNTDAFQSGESIEQTVEQISQIWE